MREGEGGTVHDFKGKKVFVFPENESQRNSTKGRLVFLAWDRTRKGLLGFAWRQHAHNVKHTVNTIPCFHREKSRFWQGERERELSHSACKLLSIGFRLSHEGVVYKVLLLSWAWAWNNTNPGSNSSGPPLPSLLLLPFQILELISEICLKLCLYGKDAEFICFIYWRLGISCGFSPHQNSQYFIGIVTITSIIKTRTNSRY